MCTNILSQLHTIAAKENLYKIESFDNESAEKIARHIRNQKGRCEVMGCAIITNHVFTNDKCSHLVGRIRPYNDLTQFDIESFIHL